MMLQLYEVLHYLDNYWNHCNDLGNISTNLIINFPLYWHLQFAIVCRASLTTLKYGPKNDVEF